MSNLIDKPIGYEYDEEFTNKLLLSNVHERAIYYEQLMDKMKQQFVEQACESIKKEIRDEMDSIDNEIGYSTSHKEGYEYAMERAQQVIKDKFK